ncbi:diacylglycerol kinase family protein [Lactobacillus sp. UCMA15818]|uniref:diacylglycerol/lipid kinase family protein n=1 Tax=Lactobacillus sp. UCMA15818 TaxID=2583394 RepID=UPI0025B09A6A|nr:diacylglycerol kinase family protein [Lactobacillus sp. UCMA15818]MDN2454431.1 diacylglycerol kinase [Lactobacillus sp. UCMA15818]
MQGKTMIYFNPKSGAGKSQRIADQVEIILKNRGLSVYQLKTNTKDEALKKIGIEAPKVDRIICIGGDGTINVLVTALLRSNVIVPIGIIPTGTVNNFAHKWNLSDNVEDAIKTVLRGRQQAIDIGECNGQAIISSLVFGSLADISNEVRQKEKQKYGFAAYGYNAIKQIGKNHSHQTLLFNQTFSMRVKVWVCLMTTSNYIGGRKYLEETEDGLHLTMLNNMKINKLLNLGYFALTGNLRRSTTLTTFDIKEITVRNIGEEMLETRIDGDKGPKLPVKIKWLPKKVQLYVN